MALKPRLPILNRSHPLAQGLVGAWLAYEGAGATARDASGRGNHGALQGNVAWVTGKDGPALDFPGTVSDYVSISPAITGYPFAFTVRFVASGASTTRNIYCESDDGFNDRYIILRLLSDGTLQFRIANGGSTSDTASPDAYTSGVHTVTCVTRAVSDNRLYVDGQEVGTDTSPTTMPTTNVAAIGVLVRQVGFQTAYDDEISFVQVHNRGIHASEIRRLHSDPHIAFRPVRRWWAVTLDVGGLTHPVIGSGIVNSRAIIGGSP